jgi:nitrate/nitrite transport system substrate-binding protein
VVFNPVPPLGLLKSAPDYAAIAGRINRIDIWKDAATAIGGITPPAQTMRTSTLMDGTRWDGTDPEQYARRFDIQRTGA